MTASVPHRLNVVRNESLPLKARPRSAASLVVFCSERGGSSGLSRRGSAAWNSMWDCFAASEQSGNHE